MEILERFKVFGHKNITSTHRTTLEFTKEEHLTMNGNCILGIRSERGCGDLSEELKRELKTKSKFLIKLKINVVNSQEISQEIIDEFNGYGDPKLLLSDPFDMVFRKSDYICNRTILIKCTKASKDINREIVKFLKDSSHSMIVEIYKVEDN